MADPRPSTHTRTMRPFVRRAWSALSRPLRRWVGDPEAGVEDESVPDAWADGFETFAEAERTAWDGMGGCLACGLCDLRFGSYTAVNRQRVHAPSDLFLAHSRARPDVAGLAVWAKELDAGVMVALERACPARVPFVAIHALLSRRVGAAGAEAGDTVGPPPPRPQPG